MPKQDSSHDGHLFDDGGLVSSKRKAHFNAQTVWSDQQVSRPQGRPTAVQPEDAEVRAFSRRLGASADPKVHEPEGKEVEMKGQVALISEQGQNFAVLLVKDRVINDPVAREELLEFAALEFGVRAAIMGATSLKTHGPQDIVRWLSGVYLEQLPWRDFWINN
jgi:hypothetical protein